VVAFIRSMLRCLSRLTDARMEGGVADERLEDGVDDELL
jgi:hypothetical protein